MDDHDFDDLLKNKFEDYEHPDDEISALDSCYRMSSFSSVPWYTKFRTETSVASLLLLFTFLNGFMMWNGASHNDFSAAENNRLADRALIDSLLHEIRTLKSPQQQPSVYVINPANSITAPLTSGNVKSEQPALAVGYTPAQYDGSRLHLGRIDSLPTDVLAKLSEEGVLESDNGEA